MVKLIANVPYCLFETTTTTSLPATMDRSSNIDFPTVPGCTVYLHPSRDPHNTNGYLASRNTPFVCYPTRNQPPTIWIPQAIPQSTPQAIPQVIPQAIPQPIPLPTFALQAPVVPQWRQRLDDVTILYNTVTDKVNGGLSLSQALAQVNLIKDLFQRRRVIAETYISLPECVKSSLQKANFGGDVESIFLRCRAISKTAKGKSKIREMAINGFILPLDI